MCFKFNLYNQNKNYIKIILIRVIWILQATITRGCNSFIA